MTEQERGTLQAEVTRLEYDASTREAILAKAIRAALADSSRLEQLVAGVAKADAAVCQTLGKALGYPWYKDDQKNFPGATEDNGVCVGEHVPETLAMEAARRLEQCVAALRQVRAAVDAALEGK